MARMDASERLSKLVLEAVLPGAELVWNDDQSHGECDFELRYPDGRICAVEVVRSTCQAAEAARDALGKRGPFVPRSRCRHDWYVTPAVGASIKKIQKHVDEYLADIEAEGLTEFLVGS